MLFYSSIGLAHLLSIYCHFSLKKWVKPTEKTVITLFFLFGLFLVCPGDKYTNFKLKVLYLIPCAISFKRHEYRKGDRKWVMVQIYKEVSKTSNNMEAQVKRVDSGAQHSVKTL